MKMEDRLSDTDDYRRDHFVRIIERAVEKMTLKELEAVAYDLFTKGPDFITFLRHHIAQIENQ